jgi:hypothetical protein
MAKGRAMLIKTGDSTFDKIQAFYIDPEHYPLSEKLEEIRIRWTLVVNLQLKAYSKIKIANVLVRDYGVCQAQAYLDIRNAGNMFANVFKTDEKVFKAMWMEWATDLLKRARQHKDLKAEAKALDLLGKYGGLDVKDLEFNPEKFENKEIHINMNKNLQGKLIELIAGGVVDFNSLDVTEVDFEELKPEPDNE